MFSGTSGSKSVRVVENRIFAVYLSLGIIPTIVHNS
jgi:hypothetical protein